MLSPVYEDSARGGCWFCHNQGVDQLRLLRKRHPDYYALMLKWDAEPLNVVPFCPDGRTLRDVEKRFQLEDEGLIMPGDRFRWAMIEGDYPFQLRLFPEDAKREKEVARSEKQKKIRAFFKKKPDKA